MELNNVVVLYCLSVEEELAITTVGHVSAVAPWHTTNSIELPQHFIFFASFSVHHSPEREEEKLTLSIIKTAVDCLDFSRTISPFLVQK